jgi:hypothetical protein
VAVVQKRTAAIQFLEVSPLLVEAPAAHITATEQTAVLVVVLAAMLPRKVWVLPHKVTTVAKAPTTKMSVVVAAAQERLAKQAPAQIPIGVALEALD